MCTSSLRRLVALALGATLLLAACAPDVPPPPPPTPVAVDLAAHHQYLRALAGRGSLRLDGWIQVFAQYHADRLAVGATTCGNLWHSQELATWYAGYAAGENVACLPGCPTDGRRAFELWVHSPPHAANVFHPDYGVLGVGVTCNGRVQMVVAHYRTP